MPKFSPSMTSTGDTTMYIQIKDSHQWKAAFITHKGLFKPTVMFFGLTNSPATFQRFMNDSFHNMIGKGWLVIYVYG